MKPIPYLLFIILATFSHAADEPQADPAELPRIPATSPADAPATFEIRPGFAVELAAAEPLVADPIDIEFDEHGRMFVVEMIGYSEHREDALGRVKLLVDENDDGVFDSSTVFAKDLHWPTSVTCYDGGVFVVASPDIFYFKDSDGDGIAEHKETVFTGFGSQATRLNMQALVNSLTWGPDNRIWGATAGNGGNVHRANQPGTAALDLRRKDFSFDPRTREIRAENGTAQFGMSFDSTGQRYVCSNSNHIRWVAWERNWFDTNPYFPLPSPIPTIAADGASAPVFRISPDEPWRIVRTRWRVSGVVKGAVEGGGRVSGYFTAATGITIYTGDAFDASYRDTAFIGDAGSNLVHHKLLHRPGGAIQPVAERLPGEAEKQTEFLRSTDNWFRPVNFANGPDGCLYICDMYRETIEHPWSIPEGIKQYVDLDSGNDRGRIWRVVPTGFKHPKFSLDRESNGWQQRVKRRLAYESGKPMAPIRPAYAKAGVRHDLSDPWGAAFTLNALTDAGAMATAWKQSGLPLSFRASLAEMIGKTGDTEAIGDVIDHIAASGITAASETLLTSLGSGLRAKKLTLAKVDPDGRLAPLFAGARETATGNSASEKNRASALRLLALDPGSGDTIRQLVADPKAPDAVRKAAIAALGSARGVDQLLLEHWAGLSPSVKSTALTALTSRSDRSIALLEAVDSGTVAKEDIPLNTATLLRGHRDKNVAALAAKVFPAPEVIDRATVVARYQKALKLEGDPARGATVYKTGACFTCHKSPSGEGFAVGPDLATFKTAGGDSIITNLFNPNAEVAPQYQAFAFSLHNGEAVIGIIANEDAQNVTVRMAGGIERTFPRKDVAGMKGLGQSLMPEGLEAALSLQDVADLLAFITANEN